MVEIGLGWQSLFVVRQDQLLVDQAYRRAQSSKVRLNVGKSVFQRVNPASNNTVILHLEAQYHAPLLLEDTLVALCHFLPLKGYFFVKLLDSGV